MTRMIVALDLSKNIYYLYLHKLKYYTVLLTRPFSFKGLVYGFKMASSALAYFIYPNVVSMPMDIPENAPLIRHRIMIILYACKDNLVVRPHKTRVCNDIDALRCVFTGCIVNIMTILLCLVYHLIPKNDGNSSTLINESKSSTELYENVNYFSSIKAICEYVNRLPVY